MAEYCLAHIVERERSFGAFRRAQEQAMWSPAEDYSYRTLGELRIGILGLGDIGAHVAATLRSCGCTDVHALVRRPRSSTSSSCGDSSRSGDSGRSSSSSAAGGSNTRHDSGSGGDGTSGGGAGVTLHGALPSLLRARCDYLINTLPSTRATSGLLDGDTLAAACAPGGSAQQHQQLQQRAPVLINVGRGDVASEAALLRALDAGWLSGAVLDVLPAEPLPRSSPLWRARGVTITPHVAAKSTAADVARVFRENLRRHARGQPLLYTVDWDQGY
ncbi:hypothetical protein JKP88DRAFT_295988 [Tribonema minus]|uniref:D-isomer specific 2-hydroxyacid dehydrogenase NAD-binding domain-containing protein n=1 Tax=Tribonema minus TaxID=303371 RepID=A0A836CN13_9STRA|nr:hypothetical protein JKP88DRAFT_295988 [Tribonema minus]